MMVTSTLDQQRNLGRLPLAVKVSEICRLSKNVKFHDVDIRCSDGSVTSNAAFLAACGPWWKALLTTLTQDVSPDNTVIIMPDVKCKAIRRYLKAVIKLNVHYARKSVQTKDFRVGSGGQVQQLRSFVYPSVHVNIMENLSPQVNSEDDYPAEANKKVPIIIDIKLKRKEINPSNSKRIQTRTPPENAPPPSKRHRLNAKNVGIGEKMNLEEVPSSLTAADFYKQEDTLENHRLEDIIMEDCMPNGEQDVNGTQSEDALNISKDKTHVSYKSSTSSEKRLIDSVATQDLQGSSRCYDVLNKTPSSTKPSKQDILQELSNRLQTLSSKGGELKLLACDGVSRAKVLMEGSCGFQTGRVIKSI